MEPTDASNQSPSPQPTGEDQTGAPQPVVEGDIEKRTSTTWNIVSPLKTFLGRVFAILGALTTFAWMVALWDSYRPKIAMSPAITMDPKYPFSTVFTMQNEGALPIQDITYKSEWRFQLPRDFKGTNGTPLMEQNMSVVRQLDSLECYSFSMNYRWFTNADFQALAGATAILLQFEVTYTPKYFFGRRKNVFNFYGTADANKTWQWLPTGHASINDQTIDTNLLSLIPKSGTFVVPVIQFMTNAVVVTNPPPAPLSGTNVPLIKNGTVGGGIPVHTN